MKLILIRGLPGSGKSTLAKMLLEDKHGAHYEADQYFMEDGEYNFNVDHLRHAHRWCQDQTRLRLAGGCENEVVIVSNTFTTLKELRPYFDIASEFDITPQVITCHGCWVNEHDVPEETLNRMKQRFVSDISSLYEKKDG